MDLPYIDCIYDRFNKDQNNIENFSTDLINFLTCEDTDLIKKNMYKNIILSYCRTKEFNYKKLKLIGEGGFGAVYRSDNVTVVKIPVNFSFFSDDFKKNKNDDRVISFLEEQITNIILFCCAEKIKKIFPSYIQSFPNIYSVINLVSRVDSNEYNVGAIMEELLPLKDVFMKFQTVNKFNSTIDIIIQIANSLYILQSLFKFMHRDLHYNNIMCKKNDNPSKDIVLYDGSILYDQDYIIIFIDFGFTCLTLGDNVKICSNSKKSDENSKDVYVFKKDYDLRLFLYSLYHYLDWHADSSLSKLVHGFFNKSHLVEHEKKVGGFFQDLFYGETYKYRDQSLYRDDKEFYPENLIPFLFEYKNSI